MSGSNLVILGGTSHKLSRGQARDWRPHEQKQATTIPAGQNCPRVKNCMASVETNLSPNVLQYKQIQNKLTSHLKQEQKLYYQSQILQIKWFEESSVNYQTHNK